MVVDCSAANGKSLSSVSHQKVHVFQEEPDISARVTRGAEEDGRDGVY
jgi:hypothetical protein